MIQVVGPQLTLGLLVEAGNPVEDSAAENTVATPAKSCLRKFNPAHCAGAFSTGTAITVRTTSAFLEQYR